MVVGADGMRKNTRLKSRGIIQLLEIRQERVNFATFNRIKSLILDGFFIKFLFLQKVIGYHHSPFPLVPLFP
jgi:hypothetical protein